MKMMKRVAAPVVAAGLLVAWLDGVEARGALQPVDLRCAQRENPLGIGDATPRLSWRVESTTPGSLRGEVQSAYEIRVGSVPGLAD